MSALPTSTPARAMIALFPTPEAAAELALDPSLSEHGLQVESAEDIHVTLGYFPEVTTSERDYVIQQAAILATMFTPVATKVEGVAKFGSEDGEVPIVLLMDPTRLTWMHQMVLEACPNLVSTAHGFIPHATLAYAPESAALRLPVPPDVTLNFSALSVVIGTERHDFRFVGDESPDETAASISGGAMRYMGRLQAQLDEELEGSEAPSEPPVVSRTQVNSMEETSKARMPMKGESDDDPEDDCAEDPDMKNPDTKKMKPGMKAEMPEPGRLVVFKDAHGEDRWLSISTSAFRDKDHEIIPTALLERAVEQADKAVKADRGPLRLWHTPGFDIGDCDFQAMEGRLLVESGTFRASELATRTRAYLATTKEAIGVSIGFLYPKNQFDRSDRTYGGSILIHERSILPRAKAAHGWTDFVDLGGSMDSTKKAFLEEIAGPEAAAAIISKASAQSKELEASGVQFKSVDGKDLTMGETVAALGETLKDSPEPVKVAYAALALAVKEAENPPSPPNPIDVAMAAMKELLAPIVEAQAKNEATLASLAGGLKSVTDVIAAAQAAAAKQVDDSPRGARVFRASDKATDEPDDEVAAIVARAEALAGSGKEAGMSPNDRAASPYVADIIGRGR